MINGTDIKRIKSLVATFVIASFSFAQTTIVFQVVEMRGEKYNAVTERILTSAKLQDYNSFEIPGKIKPAMFKNFKQENSKITITLPPFSVLVLELKQ